MDINVENIAQVAVLAREIDRAEAEFDAFVDALGPDQQAELVAVFWIGRGSFESLEFEEARQTALNEASSPTKTYLKGSPHLADHLEAGLAALGFDPNDIEEAVY